MAMKLYEFTYSDNQNLSEAELLKRVEAFLQSEGERQGWSSGYQFQQCKSADRLPDGSVNYFFEVTGQYLDSESTSFETEMGSDSGRSEPLAASPPLNP